MFFHRKAKKFARGRIQAQPFRRAVELELSGLERIERDFDHWAFPPRGFPLTWIIHENAVSLHKKDQDRRFQE
jgi:hypothetical protein